MELLPREAQLLRIGPSDTVMQDLAELLSSFAESTGQPRLETGISLMIQKNNGQKRRMVTMKLMLSWWPPCESVKKMIWKKQTKVLSQYQ